MSTPSSSSESTPTANEIKPHPRQLSATPNPPILSPSLNLSRRRPLPLLSTAIAASSTSSSNPNGSQLELLEEIEPYVRRRRAFSACPVQNGSSSAAAAAVGSDDSSQASSQQNDRARRRMETLSEEEQQLLRTCINSRERKRMHDLNDALDDLRRALPYGCGEEGSTTASAGSRKLSKINTIILAANWIRQMTKELENLRNQLSDKPPMVNGEKKTPSFHTSPTIEEPVAKKGRLNKAAVNGDEPKKEFGGRPSDTVSPYASIPSLLEPKLASNDKDCSSAPLRIPIQSPSPFLPQMLLQQANFARSLLYHQSIGTALPPGLLPSHPLFSLFHSQFNPTNSALLTNAAPSAFKPSRVATSSTSKGKSSAAASRKRNMPSVTTNDLS